MTEEELEELYKNYTIAVNDIENIRYITFEIFKQIYQLGYGQGKYDGFKESADIIKKALSTK